MTNHEGVVYDLDGTLVRLDVDWRAVDSGAADIVAAAGGDPTGEVWDMLDEADELGVRDEVEALVSEHEREGARRARRLPLADELADRAPVAVCSLNCEAAVRIALREHGLDEYVDHVVGRDSVATRKPDPEPLHAALSAIGVDPADAVFVGDSPTDRTTAERAGTAFEAVEEGVRR